MSMYKHVNSNVKLHNVVSEGFECMLGVRQGGCLSPFLFAMYLNDLEEEFRLKGSDGIDIGMLNIFLLLYADDIILFAQSSEELQKSLDTHFEYCQRYKLSGNTSKTKVMFFLEKGVFYQEI